MGWLGKVLIERLGHKGRINGKGEGKGEGKGNGLS
jgi:hypothetical protein